MYIIIPVCLIDNIIFHLIDNTVQTAILIDLIMDNVLNTFIQLRIRLCSINDRAFNSL